MENNDVMKTLLDKIEFLENEVKELKKENANNKLSEMTNAYGDVNYMPYQKNFRRHRNNMFCEKNYFGYGNYGRGMRDTTKYIFNGVLYCKGRLVLAVIKKYMEDHPNTTAEELKNVFHSSLQGSNGIIKTYKEVIDFYGNRCNKRFFIRPEEIISTSTEDCVVCNQWGYYNIENFITRAKQLNFEIQKVEN